MNLKIFKGYEILFSSGLRKKIKQQLLKTKISTTNTIELAAIRLKYVEAKMFFPKKSSDIHVNAIGIAMAANTFCVRGQHQR